MTNKQKIKAIKEEIEWYRPKKRIADLMLKLGKLGFEFSGHGCGFGGEDYGLLYKNYYVSICDQGKSVEVIVNYCNEETDEDIDFIGTIGQALKYIEKKLK